MYSSSFICSYTLRTFEVFAKQSTWTNSSFYHPIGELPYKANIRREKNHEIKPAVLRFKIDLISYLVSG